MTFNPSPFFASIRSVNGSGLLRYNGHLDQDQVDGISAILERSATERLPLAHVAYVLATPWHETKQTMQPVREAYYLGAGAEAWRKSHLRYYPWYGRGLVQLTWEGNYDKADAECAAAGLTKPGDIKANPDLVMRLDISVFILVRGMKEGWFTGATLASTLPLAGVATRDQYMHARRIINGTDAADLIEDYAQAFERALRDGAWA